MRPENATPRFFTLHAASRIYLNTVTGISSHDPAFVARYPPGPLSVGFDGGTVWSRTVSNTDGLLIVERSLGDAMIRSGLIGLDEHYPIRIRPDWPAAIHKKKLADAPEYIWFRIRRDIQVDPETYRWPPAARAPNFKSPYRKIPGPMSHGGTDVFGVSNAEWTSIFCTRRFVELTRKNKWKGFLFEPMDVIRRPMVNTYLDHLGKVWPPEKWYPEGVEPHPNNLETFTP